MLESIDMLESIGQYLAQLGFDALQEYDQIIVRHSGYCETVLYITSLQKLNLYSRNTGSITLESVSDSIELADPTALEQLVTNLRAISGSAMAHRKIQNIP